MKRRFNYTGRRKIERDRIIITFMRQNNAITSFVLEKLDLNGLALPGNALVYVEAYYRTELKRFKCGTVDSMNLPFIGDLTDMAYRENLKLRILVAEPTDWRILAHADSIAPEQLAERKAILPVEFRDLESQVWGVEYEGDYDGPILCINNRIPNIENIAKQDSRFFVHVYPAVIREILTRMVFVEGVDSVSEPFSDWHGEWLIFSTSMAIQPPSVLDPENDDFDKDAASEWIDDVVKAFSNRYAVKFQEFLTQTEERP